MSEEKSNEKEAQGDNGEEGGTSSIFGSGSSVSLFGGGLTQPTFSFSGKTDFSIAKFSAEDNNVPTATYADEFVRFRNDT